MAVLIAFPVLVRTFLGQRPSEAPTESLLHNGGFEEPASPVPAGWFRDVAKSGDKGTASHDQARFHSGRASIKLQPNRRNRGANPLAIAQVIPAARFRGQEVAFSGYLAAEGDATAVLGMLSVVGGQHEGLVTAKQTSGGSGWVRKKAVYDVPDDPSVQLVLICFVEGASGAAWFDDVSVVPSAAESPGARDTASQTALKASVEVDGTTVIRHIPRTLYGTNVEWRWNANSLWLEYSHQPHPEIVRLTRELNISLIRYPGGVYSDAYHWKDGIGPYEKRPEVIHEPGLRDRSRPNFGTDEALHFARQVNGQILH